MALFIIKKYFVTVFLVISFQQNKRYPNKSLGPVGPAFSKLKRALLEEAWFWKVVKSSLLENTGVERKLLF